MQEERKKMLPENENKNDGRECHHCKVSDKTLGILKQVCKQKNMKRKSIEFKFRKLFQKVSEGDYCGAIICYHKVIREWRNRRVDETDCEAFPFKWEHRLMIDLLVCRILINIKQTKKQDD